jgi:hypothetical protein
MADYSHTHSHAVAGAARGADQTHFGWMATVLAAVVLAAMAWAWTQQQTVESPLPQPISQTAAPVAMTPADRFAPAMTRPAPEVAPPPSQAVAAAGDTRALRP